MSEAVAIISVSASAVVGIGGLLAASWGGSRERHWQTQEERAIELRAVLEAGGSQLARLLLALDEAHGEVRARGALSTDTSAAIEVAEKAVIPTLASVGVRRGSRAPEYRNLGKYWLAVSAISTILREADGSGLDAERQSAFARAWADALAAQEGYLDVTAKALGSAPTETAKT